MADRPFVDEQICDLIAAVCNETILPEELAQLEGALRESAVARHAYHDYMLLHAELYWRESALADTARRILPVNEDLATRPLSRSRWLSFGSRLAAAVLCGVLITYFAVLAVLVSLRQPQKSFVAQSTEPMATRTAVARLTALENCRWSAAESTVSFSRTDAIHAGAVLSLERGAAEITFDRGTKVVLEGPAQLTVESSNEGYLHRGKLLAQVPKQAVGFKVQTVSASVVDLGTEFGVEVDSAGKTDVHVLNGEVVVKNVAGAQVATDAEVRLVAGQAVRVTKGKPTADIPLNRNRFTHSLGFAPTTENLAGKSLKQQLAPVSFVHNFNEATLRPYLALGRGGGSARVDFSRGTFAIASATESRSYLGTIARNYSTVNFVFEATAIMPEGIDAWGDAFFGMGISDAVGMQREPEAPNVLAVIRLDDANGNTNGFETRDSAEVNSTLAASGIAFTPRLSGDTVRLRMTWDATTKQAQFEADAHYTGGPFVADYRLTVDGSDNSFGTWNSQLILGGGNGLQFDDIRVIVNENSSPAKSEQTNDQSSP